MNDLEIEHELALGATIFVWVGSCSEELHGAWKRQKWKLICVRKSEARQEQFFFVNLTSVEIRWCRDGSSICVPRTREDNSDQIRKRRFFF